jgi:outer membrane protein assembly factor BamA
LRARRRALLIAGLLASGVTNVEPAAVAAAAEPPAAKPAAPPRFEVGIVPLVGGDTDVGVGVGQLSSVAVVPATTTRSPYRWALESSAFISFKADTSASGGFLIPYQDYYVQWTAPELLDGRLRLEARPSFTRETTQRYYGLGNASPAPEKEVATRDFYGRTHPMVWARGRYRFWDGWSVGLGAYYTHNWMDIPPTSTLAMQMRSVDPFVRGLLGHATRHGVLLFETLLLYDSRDDEIDTERGQYHQIKFRFSPLIDNEIPYAYQQVNLTSRFFHTLIPDRLVLAARVLADFLFGQPPFYELARYDDTYALGGVNGVRGVPGQRYYGKVKVVTNWEARVRVGAFKLRGKPMMFGVAAFADAGRAWTELGASHPDLDGTGWGIKYGFGAGVRLTQGKTFVVRGDIAWSPDARPIGGYVNAGQMF